MQKLKDMASAIRVLSAEAIDKSNSGHPGMPLGMADVATVLFSKYLKFNPEDPKWFDRDRFILSAGHGSMLLYSLLYLTGYEDINMQDIKNFRQLGSKTAGHPEYGHIEGIDMTTGPLGQGIATATGFALSEAVLSAKYGKDVCDHFTYAICGDGCLMEGISEEAISFAGHNKLNKLILFWDDNKITIDGSTDISTSTDILKRFEANGWDTQSIDGHSYHQIETAIQNARSSKKPSLIACKTTIGFGAPNKQGSNKVHGAPLGADETKALKEALNWQGSEFEVPKTILNEWRKTSARCEEKYEDWTDNAKAKGKEFKDIIANKLPKGWDKELNKFMKDCLKEKPTIATRKASQLCIEKIVPAIPYIIGGSADLDASNLTSSKDMVDITPENYSGNKVNYGIREHFMAACMNGMKLHGGVLPYGGTFFVFSDYLRPALRLSALMEQGVIYVLTHDSIGVGEDGPTHQPIEHLASYRAMPNVNVFRPADVIETAEAWKLAIETDETPSILALTRQGLPLLRGDVSENMTARGGYVLSEATGERDITLIATGSEVSLAMEVKELLAKDDINAAVVSMPCMELFDAQSFEYKEEVLGEGLRVSIEAGTTFGWHKYADLPLGIDSFGMSGKAADVFENFGLTAKNIAAQLKKIS